MSPTGLLFVWNAQLWRANGATRTGVQVKDLSNGKERLPVLVIMQPRVSDAKAKKASVPDPAVPTAPQTSADLPSTPRQAGAEGDNAQRLDEAALAELRRVQYVTDYVWEPGALEQVHDFRRHMRAVAAVVRWSSSYPVQYQALQHSALTCLPASQCRTPGVISCY
jgi:hypothetical protein